MRADDERWSWLGPALGALALIWINARIQPWTLDDAYITYRYAENLAAGHGPVWNPGERVEGYTTPLWMAVLAAGHALGADTRTLSKVLGGLCALGVLGLLAVADRLVPGLPPRAGRLAAGLVGSSGIFAAWALPGMEVPLVALCGLATALFALRDAARPDGRAWVGFGLGGAFALMSRPDAVVLVGALALASVGRAARARDLRALRGPALTAGLYGPFFLARWAYYGWPLPNTFYAKVGATGDQVARGLGYLSDAAVLLVPFAAFGLCFLRWPGAARPVAALLGAIALHAGYVASVGGDVMPAFRFLAGVLPVLGLAVGAGAARLPAGAGALGLLASVGFGLWQFEVHPDLAPRIARGVVGRNGEEVGRWLAENAPPGSLLATNTAGSVAYYSRLPAIDMLGLNDAHIAHVPAPRMGAGKAGHEKADGAYVFGRQPDLVHLGSARGSPTPMFRSDRELVRQPGFAERYELQRHRLPSGAVLTLYVRRGFAWRAGGDRSR